MVYQKDKEKRGQQSRMQREKQRDAQAVLEVLSFITNTELMEKGGAYTIKAGSAMGETSKACG